MRRLVQAAAVLVCMGAGLAYSKAATMSLHAKVAASTVVAVVSVEETSPLDVDPGVASRPVWEVMRNHQVASVQVLKMLRGTAPGKLAIEYDNGFVCPNVLYAAGEQALVFLRRLPNGRYETVNYDFGKYLVRGDQVVGWPGATRGSTPLHTVAQQVAKARAR